MNLMKWVKEQLMSDDQQPTFCGHIIITFSLIGIIWLLNSSCEKNAQEKAEKWLNNITTQDDKISQTNKKNDPPKSKCYTSKDIKNNFQIVKQPINDVEIIRLREQCQDIENLIKYHQDLMIFLYERAYASMMTRIILVILAGACIFFISKKGWEQANNALINAFIVLSLTSLFLTQLRSVFQGDINLKSNRALYIAYSKLYNQLLSYSTTGSLILQEPEIILKQEKPKLILPSIFIYYIDTNIAKLYQVSLDWEPNQILKIQDVIDNLSTHSITPGNPPNNTTPTPGNPPNNTTPGNPPNP